MKALHSLTVIVLTFNRYEKLLRLLRYIDSSHYSFSLFILDSSSQPNKEAAIPELIQKRGAQYFKYDSAIHPIDKICDGLSKVTTPYVAFWADDDFLVLKTLEQGVAFLENNNDFVMAHGQGGKFNAQWDPHHTKLVIDSFSHYQLGEIGDSTAVERLRHHLNYYTVTLYSVHRTTVLRHSMKLTKDHGFGYGFGEIIPSCLSVIQGKIKKMKELYFIKEVHDQNSTWGTPVDFFDWVTSSFFSENFRKMQDCLAREIARVDRIDLEKAREVVKEAFWKHIADRMHGNWIKQYRVQSKAKQKLRQWKTLHSLWMFFRSLGFREQDRFLLPALKRKTSPYHEDFVSIYPWIQ